MGRAFLAKAPLHLTGLKGTFGFFAALWFHAKYAQAHELMTLIVSNRPLWSADAFLSRQVVVVLPRLLRNPAFHDE